MEITIKNNLEEIYSLEHEILRQVEEAGYEENSSFAIRLALDEALVNAYKHGNAENPNKSLRIRYEIDEKKIDIEIEDEGAGFDQSQLMDPRSDERLKETSGRGIFLIRQFMSKTLFNEYGNLIRFVYEKKDHQNTNPHGLTQWKTGQVDVLELDPILVDKDPTIVLESILYLLKEDSRGVVLDLKFLDRIDSCLLGLLVAATREAESRGKHLVNVRLQPEVDRIIEATSLNVVLKTFADLTRGIEFIGASKSSDSN
ncbi:MAG: ATP-binding protein [Candidatus Omnitrophica bacterium]|nr:ATP-binding protein [Candidatus Omnitrophota bacterium]MCA9431103.1 ATP-binding protein [Candidatus Omnitrophota bacterium]MCA9434542.1 ATP-binding protein [Candidatus Omnitrophota bacterium]MCA9445478.1 ATP-binding protein [Candidatus Omnitrophota bacterium]MCB9769312.1 ATP-binding protein [Candidatus Omnitrophota bacterium]